MAHVRRIATAAALGAAAGLLIVDLGLLQAISYGGDGAVVPVATALAGALLGATRLRAPLAALLALLAALWLAVGLTPLSRSLTRGLVRADVLAPADAVFVLAATIQGDGEMGNAALARLQHGASLVRAGLAPRLLLSNVAGQPSHQAAAARVLRSLGLDLSLEAVGPVSNTHDEALAVARRFRERGWRRVLLVTSPLHTRRAAAAFEHAGLEVISSPAPETSYDLDALLGGDDRLRVFGPILHERVGLLVYRWRGWI